MASFDQPELALDLVYKLASDFGLRLIYGLRNIAHLPEKDTMNDSINAGVNEFPSKAEHAANVIARTAKQTTAGELVPASIRLPSWVMSDLDAMALHSNQSRNHIINLVIAAGIEAVKVHLDKALAVELDALADSEMTRERAMGKNVSGSI